MNDTQATKDISDKYSRRCFVLIANDLALGIIPNEPSRLIYA